MYIVTNSIASGLPSLKPNLWPSFEPSFGPLSTLTHSRTSTSPVLRGQLQQQFLHFLGALIHGIPVPQPDHLPVPHASQQAASGACPKVIKRIKRKLGRVCFSGGRG